MVHWRLGEGQIPLEFIEAPVFTRLLPRHLNDDEYREFQLHLAASPRRGMSSRARAASARYGGPTADEGWGDGVA